MALRTSSFSTLTLFSFAHHLEPVTSMAASFYSSPLIGATTTLACFAHEIPHEIADYSILVRSGFTKRQAMESQFLTAVGAFVSPSPAFEENEHLLMTWHDFLWVLLPWNVDIQRMAWLFGYIDWVRATLSV